MRAVVRLQCDHCRGPFGYPAAQYNYRRERGARRFYCGQRCAGLARRTWKTKAEKVAEKAAYDREYRNRPDKRARRKAQSRAWHLANYDPAKARAQRAAIKERMRAYYVTYRARPEWRAHKQRYDAARRSALYGDFGEAHRLLVQLNKELISRSPDKYERLKARGYYQRGVQTRKRHAQVSRW